jgi:hypothetical protein
VSHVIPAKRKGESSQGINISCENELFVSLSRAALKPVSTGLTVSPSLVHRQLIIMLREKPRVYMNDVEGKRMPFLSPQVKSPWYSLNRRRNLVIISAVAVCWMFSTPLFMIGRSLKYSFKIEYERYKFRKELDREDKILELQTNPDKK